MVPELRAAVRRVQKGISKVLVEEYPSRFLDNYNLAAKWSEKRPGEAAEQIRNSYDHLSNAAKIDQKITHLQIASPSRKRKANSLASLLEEAMANIERARRHIAVANYRAIVHTILTQARLINTLIPQMERDRGYLLKDERNKFLSIYNRYLKSDRPSLVRRKDTDEIKTEREKTNELADKIDEIVDELGSFYLKLLLKAKQSQKRRKILLRERRKERRRRAT